jgi:hypothetical protein
MLVSHETPIEFLERSRKYNDYDYALVHLFETNPEYYSFFKASKTLGREVLLDNSIFELGEAFDTKKFVKYVKELEPTYYVVPDVLEDSQKTVSSFHKFCLAYPDLPGLKIGVVQGKTYQELVDCYRYMANVADYIAISFDYSWYDIITESSATPISQFHTLQKQSRGRRRLISMLQEDKVWNHNKPHHLLGCSLANEFKHYTWDKSIRSLDTSNPVVAGILNKRYLKGIGLLDKPSVLLADLITADLNEEQVKDILYNVEEFKNLLRS